MPKPFKSTTISRDEADQFDVEECISSSWANEEKEQPPAQATRNARALTDEQMERIAFNKKAAIDRKSNRKMPTDAETREDALTVVTSCKQNRTEEMTTSKSNHTMQQRQSLKAGREQWKTQSRTSEAKTHSQLPFAATPKLSSNGQELDFLRWSPWTNS